MACWEGGREAAHRAHAWHGDGVPGATPAQRQCLGAGEGRAAGTANADEVKVLGNGVDGARDGNGDTGLAAGTAPLHGDMVRNTISQ